MNKYDAFAEQNWDEYDIDEPCYECGGSGYVEGDCFQYTCCCADPVASHGLVRCPVCRGRG